MNCYEGRKKITGSVAVTVSYSQSDETSTTSGAGVITHGPLYTGWTHRELQCVGSPLTSTDDYILRGDNLCEGRAQIVGSLQQRNTITLTTTTNDGQTFESEVGIYFKYVPDNYDVRTTLLPLNPYPDWENDPYSKSFRAQIDGLAEPVLRVGLGEGTPGSPSPSEVALPWLKDGVSGVSENGTLNISLAAKFTLT